LGYFAKYLFLTTKIIEVKLSQIPKSLIESAQLTGASWWRVVWSIILPLSKKSLIIAWIIGFIFSLRETTITMLVYPSGSDTLPLYIFTQMANGEPEIIASLSLVMVGVVLIFLGGYFLIHTY
jgi:iron(III) transport system permease protein